MARSGRRKGGSSVKDLLQRARSGDDEAFAELFQGHAQALWKTALAVMRDEDEAADMLQETAVKAWQSIPLFDGASKLSTWLTRILLNACFDELRSKKRLIPFAEIANVAESSDRACVLVGGADDAALDVATHMDVRSALDALGANDRMVLTLFYVNDLSTSDIAEALDISEGAVRTRLTRARTRFKNIYSNQGSRGRAEGGRAEVAL